MGKSRIRQVTPTALCWRTWTKEFNFRNLEYFRNHDSHGGAEAPSKEGGKVERASRDLTSTLTGCLLLTHAACTDSPSINSSVTGAVPVSQIPVTDHSTWGHHIQNQRAVEFPRIVGSSASYSEAAMLPEEKHFIWLMQAG